jgi:hypothetical protein
MNSNKTQRITYQGLNLNPGGSVQAWVETDDLRRNALRLSPPTRIYRQNDYNGGGYKLRRKNQRSIKKSRKNSRRYSRRR